MRYNAKHGVSSIVNNELNKSLRKHPSLFPGCMSLKKSPPIAKVLGPYEPGHYGLAHY
jgi:hypothetical protein